MKQSKESKTIQSGIRTAREITKEYAKTFYFASKFLSRDKRCAAYSIYSICRITDEIVDTAEGSISSEGLIKLRRKIEAAYGNVELNDNLLVTFKYMINKYQIPKQYFYQLIEGMDMDLNKRRYKNFAELYSYCYKVAGIVGLIILKTFGYENPAAEQYAINLGVAMQLTNIIRDIKEDFQKGRIYLPEEEMSTFGVDEKHIASEKLDDNFINLLKFQIKRVRQCYASCTPGIKMINNLRSRFVVCVMKDLYSQILDAVERNGYDVFSKRAYINNNKKIISVLKILIKGEYTN
jgi:phytoene synthase